MSVVVERGLARCPRCVAVADYAFIESGPNSLCYEVNCRRCGQAYREVHAPVAPDFSGAVEALGARPLLPRTTALERRRRHARAWFANLRTRASALAAAVTAQTARLAAKARAPRS